MSAELPGPARTRMAAIRASGTWGSALTADEFAAIRSVGFEPVGQVFGAAVYSVGYTGSAARGPGVPTVTRRRPGPATQVSGENGPGSFAPLVQAIYQARHAAIDRMTAECTALGGHGVVGVRLSRGPFPSAGRGSRPSAPRFARRAPRTSHRRPSRAICPGRISQNSSPRAGFPRGSCSASRSGRAMTTGIPLVRLGSGRATPRWPAGPSSSASPGRTPAVSWKVTSGGSAPRAW